MHSYILETSINNTNCNKLKYIVDMSLMNTLGKALGLL